MGTAISYTECSQVAGLDQKVGSRCTALYHIHTDSPGVESGSHPKLNLLPQCPLGHNELYNMAMY